jgi:Tol biopolymer transport system component
MRDRSAKASVSPFLFPFFPMLTEKNLRGVDITSRLRSHQGIKSLAAVLLSLLLTTSISISLLALPRPSAGFAGTERILISSQKILEGPALSPDGSRVAFASSQSGTLQIWTMDSLGKHLSRVTFLSGNSSTPKFSPDGNKIAFFHSELAGHEIIVMDTDGSDLRTISGTDFVTDGIFGWSSNSCCIAYQATNKGEDEIIVRDVKNGQAVFRAEGEYPGWSSDSHSETLAYVSNQANGSFLSVADLKLGTVRNVSISSEGHVFWPAFVSNDTKVSFLASSNSSWQLMIVDLSTGQMYNMLESPPGEYEMSVLNPTLTQSSLAVPRPTNSSEVIFAAASTSPRMVDLYVAILDATIVVSHFFSIAYPGTVLDRVTNHSYSSIECLSWSGNGKYIIFVSSAPNSLNSIVLVTYVRPVVQSSYGSGA